MFKRIMALTLCAVMIVSFAGCKKEKKKKTASSAPVSSKEEVPVNRNKINPLTGVQDLDPAYENRKPVAVMVNNINFVQGYQTGVNRADIVYETEVEGGITRLMAVFKNIEAIDKLGPIRSARYPYIDLALGHDAAYIHCGTDPGYAAPHLNDVEDISVETNKYAERISNGLDWEHTLYSSGPLLWQGINDRCSTTTTLNEPWQDFTAENESFSLGGAPANTVEVAYSTSNTFVYDPATGLYNRYSQGSARTDYFSGEAVQTKNLFILNTTIEYYPDGVHRQVYLDGGSGWYAVNGSYVEITWRKGGMNEPLKFYDTAGNPLKVHQGKSWVCIVNGGYTVPVFQ